MKIMEVQQALARLGYTPGPLDGAWGRQTQAAVRRFQADNGLQVDGVLGPATLGRLFPGRNTDDDDSGLESAVLVWFKEARRLIGTRETLGSGSNPDIIEWSDDLDLRYANDGIPWCGLFVGHCIGSTLEREPLPSNVLKARAWSSFGVRTQPTPGAVMVFWRGSPKGELGHVGFYAGEDADAYRVLGGNQSDSVSLAWMRKDRFLGARWPATVPPPTPRSVQVARNEKLSWNEA